jgi:pyruvate,water dikinase
MLELDQRLAKRGIISEPYDIRFLSLDEVENALALSSGDETTVSLRDIIKNRKLTRAGTTANWNPALSTEVSKTGNVFLKGTPASPGATIGEARIILSEAEFTKLKPGEILVCRATNPSWTPLFSIASAVVTDTGGPLSHAAIVAREYGIPAVLGTKTATGVMRPGYSYFVDGSRGHVREN